MTSRETDAPLLDQVALERVLATIKADAGFFDTLTLVNPKPLNVPDANNDLERELELCVWSTERSFANGFENLTIFPAPRS